jgi:hypothetical protein
MRERRANIFLCYLFFVGGGNFEKTEEKIMGRNVTKGKELKKN